MCNEAESGSLALRLTPSPLEASTTGLPLRRRSFGYMCERAIHMADSFHPARLTRLGLAHQRHGDTETHRGFLKVDLCETLCFSVPLW
jgi:hypothetical protein